MLNSTLGIVKDGGIETLERIPLPEGKRVLVTILPDDDTFWQEASQATLERIWNSDEDDCTRNPYLTPVRHSTILSVSL